MNTESLLTLPVQAPQALPDTSPLVSRLAESFGASWVDADTIDAWAAQGGDRVVLFAGDAVRFPEGQDVAVVLPELQRAFPGRFTVGVVARADEDAIAARFGANRWPSLVFLREGRYVTTVAGMLDWQDYVERVAEALEMPASRAPTIGIPLVAAAGAAPSCH